MFKGAHLHDFTKRPHFWQPKHCQKEPDNEMLINLHDYAQCLHVHAHENASHKKITNAGIRPGSIIHMTLPCVNFMEI